MRAPIWAPWRMDYILGKKEEGGCVFCALANPDPSRMAEGLVLVATKVAYVVLNRYPFAAGHLLIVPRRHASAFGDLPEEENDALFRLVREATSRLSRAVHPDGINLGMNLGAAAGAGIAEHLHVHLVPRWAGDTNFMPVIADTRVMPQYLEATFRHLHTEFADLPGVHPNVPQA